MAANAQANQEDEARRRRLKFRCWHRGMKEVDLILGRFADARVDGMTAADLATLEALLDEPDPAILAWVSVGETPPTDQHDAILTQLIAFYR